MITVHLEPMRWIGSDPSWPPGKFNNGPGYQEFADGRYEIVPVRPRGSDRYAAVWAPFHGEPRLLAWDKTGGECVVAIYDDRRATGRGVKETA